MKNISGEFLPYHFKRPALQIYILEYFHCQMYLALKTLKGQWYPPPPPVKTRFNEKLWLMDYSITEKHVTTLLE